jgi:2,4-dienoyl-CoA reductase-like NADH-dependent reductase (Old Yellow Enzyme family)
MSGNGAGSQAVCQHDRELPDIDLLSPLQLRGMALRNRIVMSPMCQYVARDGFASDWHLVHLGSRAAGGTGLIFVEATAVAAEGRITPGCLGLWSDEQIPQLQRIVDFVHSQDAKIGIQLAHAGRKASCDVPWQGGRRLAGAEGGWDTIAPSVIAFQESDPLPRALTIAEIAEIRELFQQAVRRALTAGFDTIEIHAAHGYLLHSFLSPLSNQRQDAYGGELANRMRLLLEVVSDTRETIPAEMPLFVRISGTDWVDGGWDIEQSIELARGLKAAGVDLLDVSSGGIVLMRKSPLARDIRCLWRRPSVPRPV